MCLTHKKIFKELNLKRFTKPFTFALEFKKNKNKNGSLYIPGIRVA